MCSFDGGGAVGTMDEYINPSRILNENTLTPHPCLRNLRVD